MVDGSNIATESRTLPSLAQLDEAVRAMQAEDPDRQITVIVDATFAHRIDASERKTFEDANNAGEIVMPPAGAVGRGDAFILQVAEKADAAVLSNDSFQEFHGEHPWLFEEGRLIGGKPVEGIGWVFVDRVPVRGPTSRRATRDAKKSTKSSAKSRKQSAKRAKGPAPVPSADNPPPTGKNRRAGGDADRRKNDRRGGAKAGTAVDGAKKTTKAAAKKTASNKNASAKSAAAEESGRSSKESGGRSQPKGRSQSKGNLQELNSARDFMLFVTQHSIGDEVTGVVDRFSSHGCYLRASSAQCYLPSSAMGDPPPNRARDVVALGQTIIVRVESLDSDRRGINVVLVRTVNDDGNKQQPASGGKSRGRKERRTSQLLGPVADESAREENLTRSKTTVATKKTAKKAAKKSPAKKAAKKATKKQAAKATSSARATKAAAKKAAKKTTKKAAKKAPAKKAAKKTTKKAAKKAPAKKAAKKTTKKAAKKAPAKKAAKKTTKKAAKKAPAKKK